MSDSADDPHEGTGPQPTARLEPGRAENPMWFPVVAASPHNARAFGRDTLPKASKLPKAGDLMHTDAAGLYSMTTLSSRIAAVRAALAAATGSLIRPLATCHPPAEGV